MRERKLEVFASERKIQNIGKKKAELTLSRCTTTGCKVGPNYFMIFLLSLIRVKKTLRKVSLIMSLESYKGESYKL